MVEGNVAWWHPDPASLRALVPGVGVEGHCFTTSSLALTCHTFSSFFFKILFRTFIS